MSRNVEALMKILVDKNKRLEAEVARLQSVIDSRPAINAGLPETYIHWSQSIYVMETSRASQDAH